MKCPKCGIYARLKAAAGNIPISEDVITCEECNHVLTQEERNYLEAQVVEQRQVW
jgi:phage FluMu protein Com